MISSAGYGAGSANDSQPAPSGAQHTRIIRDAEIDRAQWDAYVEKHPQASAYQLSPWSGVITGTFGKPVYSIASVSAQGELLGALSLVRLKLAPIVDMLVSLPYCNYAGLLADRPDIGRALLEHAVALAGSLGCPLLEVRSRDPFEAPLWELRRDKVRMLLELPDSPDELGRMLGAKKRSQIRRSLREGAKIHLGGAELVDDFYRVFASKMRDLGTPVYGRAFFDNVVAALGERVHVAVLRIETTPVAAAILIRFRDCMEIPWAASDRRWDRYAVNMLLYWHALALAIEHGCSTFDFGRCTVGSGSHRFKLQWGAQERALGWLRYGRPGVAADGVQRNGATEILSAAWRRLPLPLANWLGPKLTANLPW